MSSDKNWPGLGFNPARGDTFVVRSLAHDVKTVGDELAEAHRLLSSIGKTDGVWEGEAAEAFTKKVGELPKLLRQGRDSMRDCAKALRTWQERLAAMQRDARGLEKDACEARTQVRNAEAVYDEAVEAGKGDVASGPGGRSGLGHQTELDAVKRAKDRLDELIDRAKKLEDRWEIKAGEAERVILKASENTPADPGLWDRIKDDVKGFWREAKDLLVENADLLSSISSGLAVVGLALSATGVGAPLGLVLATMGAAGGAMAGHWMGRKRGDGTSMAKIGGDALGLLPGVGAAKGFVMAGNAGKGALAAARTAPLSQRVASVAPGINEAFTNPLSMKVAAWGAEKLGKTLPNPALVQIPMKAVGAGASGYQWYDAKFGDNDTRAVTPAQPSSQAFLQATR